MAIAVIQSQNERYELKSCPPDGYIVVRRMNYGESLKRKDMMASIAMSMDTTKKGGTGETKMQMDLLQEKTSLWEFANLIVEHNLTDAQEKALNFKLAEHVRMIRGQVGDEIQMRIDQLNSFEDTEETKN